MVSAATLSIGSSVFVFSVLKSDDFPAACMHDCSF